MDNEEFLSKNRCFVACIDLLGYRSIVLDNIQVTSKMNRLYKIFENLGVAISRALHDDIHGAPVHAVSFSDSYYCSSKYLLPLLSFLEQVFASAYGFQERTYNKLTDSWVPFVRAGIVNDWAVSFRDPTLSALPHHEVFRNPVGPAVAKAYELTEEQGKLPGMRCFLEKDLFNKCLPTHVVNPPHYEVIVGERKLRFLDVPIDEPFNRNLQLVELAWPCRVISSNNCSFHNPLAKCRWQFDLGKVEEQSRRDKHFIATVQLFQRSVAICGDRNAKITWERNSNTFT